MLNPTELPSSLPMVSHWIGGRPVPGSEARAGNVFNPTTGAIAARVPFASDEEALLAVVRIVRRTREGAELGASPRASRHLLAACKAHNVACGITATTKADVDKRLKEGWKMIRTGRGE